MRTFQAFGRPFVVRDSERTGNALYLHLKKTLVPKVSPPRRLQRRMHTTTNRSQRAVWLARVHQEEAADAGAVPPEKKPRQLAIGVEGGFSVDDAPTYIETNALVLLPDFVSVPLPCPELPELVTMVINGILVASSASRNDDVMAWAAEPRAVSK